MLGPSKTNALTATVLSFRERESPREIEREKKKVLKIINKCDTRRSG